MLQVDLLASGASLFRPRSGRPSDEVARASSRAILNQTKDFIESLISGDLKGDVARDDSQRPFLTQHRVQMLKQYCSHSKQ